MKSIAYIVLTLQIFLASVIPNMDLHELAKIPSLVRHYQEHKSGNSSANFLDFLADHYANNGHKETPDHANLPLHHHDCPVNHSPEPVSFLEISPIHFELPQNTSFHPAEDISSGHNYSVWQPPKFNA